MLLSHLDCVRLIYRIETQNRVGFFLILVILGLKIKRSEHNKEVENRLKAQFPIKSLITRWMERHLNQEMEKYDKIHKYTFSIYLLLKTLEKTAFGKLLHS